MEHFTEILQHRVKFTLKGDNAPSELDGCSQEHIEKHIKEGYREGELAVNDANDNTFWGWWSIERPCCYAR